MNSTHALYRFFNTKGELLYVGITNDPENRFRGHRADKPWWCQMATMKVENFKSRDELALAELQAIQSERPKYNKANLQPRENVVSRRSATHLSPDASRFGNIQDETPPRRPKVTLPYPCPNCHTRTVSQYLTEDGKRDYDEPVQCGYCGESWTYETWKQSNGLHRLL